jgi:hypothetical protein
VYKICTVFLAHYVFTFRMVKKEIYFIVQHDILFWQMWPTKFKFKCTTMFKFLNTIFDDATVQ